MLAYLLLRDNIKSGPYSLEELKVTGIRATDLLWIEGRSSAWRYADEIEELQAFVHAATINTNGSRISDNDLPIHHQEDEGNKISQSNQAANAPFLQTEANINPTEEAKAEKDQLIENKPDIEKIQEAVSRKSLEIRKSLLAKKEPGYLPVSHAENEKQGNNETYALSSKLIKIIIADDHTLFREGVKIALSQKKDIKITGEADNGAQLLNLLKHNKPDVILLDIQMPVMDGISALTAIRKLYADMKVIILSMHDGHSMVSTLMENGANAYLTKTADPETIYQAIKTCYEKDYYFNDLTNVSILEELRKKNKITERTMSPAFDGAQLMMQLTAAQKKSSRHSYKKTKNGLLVAILSVLLIVSGTVAGLSLLSQPKQLKAILPSNTKKPAGHQPAVTIHAITYPPAQAVDPLQKKASEEMPAEEKTNLLLNEKKQAAIKHKQIKTTDSFKAPALLIVQNTDSISKANNAATAKKALSADDELIISARNNIRNLVTAAVNDYHKGLFGGLSDIQLTVNNRSAYTIDEVSIEVKYLLSGSKLHKTETLHFQNISPTSTLTLEAPKSSRGVKIDYRILTVKSKELGL
jgi:DNA-binding NarL/FixJ family response regulator